MLTTNAVKAIQITMHMEKKEVGLSRTKTLYNLSTSMRSFYDG